MDQGQHRAHGTQRGAGAYRVFWSSVREPLPTRKGIVQVNPNSFLYIREKPSISAPVVTLAYNGDRSHHLRRSQGWYTVGLPDGQLGFANARYIRPV